MYLIIDRFSWDGDGNRLATDQKEHWSFVGFHCEPKKEIAALSFKKETNKNSTEIIHL